MDTYGVQPCMQPVAAVRLIMALCCLAYALLVVLGVFEFRANAPTSLEGDQLTKSRPHMRRFWAVYVGTTVPFLLLCVLFMMNYPHAFWAWTLCILGIFVVQVATFRLLQIAVIAPFVRVGGGAILHSLRRSRKFLRFVTPMRYLAGAFCFVSSIIVAALSSCQLRRTMWFWHLISMAVFLALGGFSAAIQCVDFTHYLTSQISEWKHVANNSTVIPLFERMRSRVNKTLGVAIVAGVVMPLQMLINAFVVPMYWPFVVVLLLIVLAVRFTMLYLFTSVRSRSTWFACCSREKCCAHSGTSSKDFASSFNMADNPPMNQQGSEITASRILLNFLLTSDGGPEPYSTRAYGDGVRHPPSPRHQQQQQQQQQRVASTSL